MDPLRSVIIGGHGRKYRDVEPVHLPPRLRQCQDFVLHSIINHIPSQATIAQQVIANTIGVGFSL